METFLAIFTGAPEAMARWQVLPADEQARRMAEGTAAWHAWGDRHRERIVSMGGPLGRTKRVTTAGVVDIRNAMGAYTVVQAESHEAAARMFENHPHFAIFPGDGVEVMPVLPIPPRQG